MVLGQGFRVLGFKGLEPIGSGFKVGSRFFLKPLKVHFENSSLGV